MEAALERAKAVLQDNKYFVLATVDEDGPWAATLAHTIVGNCLYFFSHTSSRHARAVIQGNCKIAGVIYNSQCTPDTAESLQFGGIIDIVQDRHSIVKFLSDEQSSEVDKILQNQDTLLFRIKLENAYVLDQALYAEQGIDAREAVDIEQLF